MNSDARSSSWHTVQRGSSAMTAPALLLLENAAAAAEEEAKVGEARISQQLLDNSFVLSNTMISLLLLVLLWVANDVQEVMMMPLLLLSLFAANETRADDGAAS